MKSSKVLLYILLFIPILTNARSRQIGLRERSEVAGIKWVEDLSWEQIKDKAKKHNKFIFVDCFAEWCGPCKYMEKEVYSKDTVGKFMNDKFISVKIQIDTSKVTDNTFNSINDQMRAFRLKYNITTLPTYLFFSPDGVIVHKGIGSKSVGDFLIFASAALHPDRQFYTLLEDYRKNLLTYTNMRFLATYSRKIDEKEIAAEVEKNYKTNYLFKLMEDQLMTKENIEFMKSSIESSRDPAFRVFYYNSEKIDEIMNTKNYARAVIDLIITQEEILPIIKKSLESKKKFVNWNRIHSKIEKKYNGKFAQRTLIYARENYYSYLENWYELHKAYIERYRNYGVEGTFNGTYNIDGVTNNMGWNIFLTSNDQEIIREATVFMEEILQSKEWEDAHRATMMDTYSNLLYKAGMVEKAIKWETKAVELAISCNLKNKAKSWVLRIEKMKSGEPTWPVD